MNSVDISIGYKRRPIVYSEINNLDLSGRIIKDLRREMNAIHGVELSDNYWTWLLMPHVQLFVEQVNDRFQLCRENLYNADHILSGEEKTTHEIYEMHWSQALNNEIARDILYFEHPSIKKIVRYSEKPINKIFYIIKLIKINLHKIKKNIAVLKKRKYYKYLVDKNVRIILLDEILINNNQYLIKNIPDSHNLNKEFFRPIILRNCWDNKFKNFRERGIGGTKKNDDVSIKFIYKFLIKYLPKDYLEHFSQNYTYYKNISCELVVCTSPINWSPHYRFVFSSLKNRGAKVLSFQHGGGYCLSKYDSQEIMEKEFSDNFIYWGGKNGIVASNIFNPNKVDLKINIKDIDVLIIGPMFKKYHRYDIGMHPYYNTCVAERIGNLISALNNDLIKVVYRSYGNKPDLVMRLVGEKYYLDSSIQEQIIRSKVVVCTKPTTIINQCIDLGILPILFWGNEYDLNEIAINGLSKLNGLNYYFDSNINCKEAIIDAVENFNNQKIENNPLRDVFKELFGGGASSNNMIVKAIESSYRKLEIIHQSYKS